MLFFLFQITKVLELREILHYGSHYIIPFVIALIFYKKDFWKVSILILSANLIDLDHLIATPIFDPNRCSIGFHFLHSYYAITIYFVLLLSKQLRIVGIGLLLHIVIDLMDCFLMK